MFIASFLVLMKVLPGLVVTFVIFGVFTVAKKRWKDMLVFIGGGFFAVSLFSLYFLSQGTFVEMVREVFIEAIVSYKSVFAYPVPFGFFYQPNNIFIYGVGGKPWHWVYVWVLLAGGVIGGLSVLYREILGKHNETKNCIKVILVLSLVAQWIFLFLLPSVFIQHYLPVNWLLALFLAVVIDGLVLQLRSHMWKVSAGLVCFIFLLLTGKQSVEANFSRSKFDMATEKQMHEARWRIIPENEQTFPNFLFRPLAYPVPYAHFIGNIPDAILYRLPDIEKTLEQKKVKYVIVSDYYLAHLKPNVQEYIHAHYRIRSDDAEVYELIK